MTNLYTMTEPTEWARPPATYSFSSLHTIQSCPRRWQLLNSRWGDFRRFPERPNAKAAEGQIIHEALEKLMRALGTYGQPALGSALFRQAIAELEFWDLFAREVEAQNAAIAEHPRATSNSYIRTPPRDIANKAIRMFKEQYHGSGEGSEHAAVGSSASASSTDVFSALKTQGSLSELEVYHPTLPFKGLIDLVTWDGEHVTLVDFKTGIARESHTLQLEWYGVLWWRRTGVLPRQLSLHYLNTRKTWEFTEDAALQAEEAMKGSIQLAESELRKTPAPAKPGDDCTFCSVRALCDSGWASLTTQPLADGTCDLELTILSTPIPTGFRAACRGTEIDVVFDINTGKSLPPFDVGSTLRVLSCSVRDRGKTVELKPWTEVFLATLHASPD